MVAKQQDISLDLLIHPGETLAEILAERGYSQKELAIRAAVSEKHISSVISGKSNITNEFAQKLAIALNGDASFWINLQANYDEELFNIEQNENITKEEQEIASEIKNSVTVLTDKKFNSRLTNWDIIELRRILGVNNLTVIKDSKLKKGLYRQQFIKGTSEAVMYTWQYLSELAAMSQEVDTFSIEKLFKRLPAIKKIMFSKESDIITLLQQEFNACGVYFIFNRHVQNVPVQGLTVKTNKDNPLIILTGRRKFVDIFWFTLFHEVAHVIFEDYLHSDASEELTREFEERANKFAEDHLIDRKLYETFIRNDDFSDTAVRRFAKKIGVLPTIVYGRLMNDKLINWNHNGDIRERYEWSD